jgi:uncharacterized protein with FMN-binding domain
MRRISLWLLSTVCALVLLLGYRTSTMGPGGAPPAATVAEGATGQAGAATFRGPAVDTRWGPVQVEIVVSGGRITDVVAVRVPDGNRRDVEINNRAVPQLRKQALAAQSADIDTVSGATVTSEGYRESLQAAIDAAHLR